jgi:hypothetical protein
MPVGRDAAQHSFRQGTQAGGGDNHASRRRAICMAAALACMLALPPSLRAQTADGDPLVQRNIPAEASAENAVVARDRALVSGQRIAYERMAAALGLPATASDREIEAQVASLVIESERITPRGYAARITVNFRAPGAARGPLPPQTAPGTAVASVEAVARYGSFPEYLDLTRRLTASGAVARVEVLAISGAQARLRLGLRSQPQEAAATLAQGGLALDAGAPGEGWRLGLAGGR